MNQKQLLFISLFSSIIGFFALFSFLPSKPLTPSEAKLHMGYICVVGDLDIKCVNKHSFGEMCDLECVRIVKFDNCITKNIKNYTVCGKITVYKGDPELIVMGDI